MEEKNEKKKYFFKKNNKEMTTDAVKASAGGVGIFLIEVLKVAIISLAIIIPVRYFLIQPFVVKGSSMEPSLSSGDYLIIDEISYRFDKPERGDIVVFKYPKNPSQYYIKRIIGLPGEKVQVQEGNIIIFNEQFPGGIEIDEDYLPEDLNTPGDINTYLSEGEYFVLGDNRTASSDSRVWGTLGEEYIIGRAWLRGWPVSEMGAIEKPNFLLIGN